MADANFMFDDLDKNVSGANASPVSPASPLRPTPSAPATPTPLKTGAEDIFSEVDKSGKPDVFKPKAAVPGAPYSTVIPEEQGWKNNKALIFGMLFGGLILIVGGGYLALKLLTKGASPVNEAVVQEQTQTPITTPEPVEPVSQDVVNPPVQETQPVVTVPADSDLDGLTDEEEIAAGTNPNNPDSDIDGLSDREEVKVYGTDPNKADTDGDGFVDGQEVKNGFNPKGAGKLNVIDDSIIK